MEELFKKLGEFGGAIVSTKDCSRIEIANAQVNGRLWVDDFGCGFILRSQAWLDLQKWREKQMSTKELSKSEVD